VEAHGGVAKKGQEGLAKESVMKMFAKAGLGVLALAALGVAGSTPASAQSFGFSFGTGPYGGGYYRGYYGRSYYGGSCYNRPYWARPYYCRPHRPAYRYSRPYYSYGYGYGYGYRPYYGGYYRY
jgi:hypothetical protein